MNKNFIHIIFKGMCVGSTMLIPGVSGGSMAMILGVYDKLISSVSSFFKHKKESALFLGLFLLGGMIGILLFARPMEYLLERFTIPVMYFFIGTAAGGMPLIYRKANVDRVTVKSTAYLVIGVVMVIAIQMLPEGIFTETQGAAGMILLVAAGFIAAVALVLPGISVSYMLLIMGLYDTVMQSIGSLYLPNLIPLGAGMAAGVVLLTCFLENAMNRYPQPTYIIILGFVVGSLAGIFPGMPQGIYWLICPVTFLTGYGVIHMLTKFSDE